jgi:predicted DCC family thiol-disulfide oxidoreductase YuxK
METTKLIYDDHCPLCKVYTKAFIKYNFINEKARVSFSDLDNHGFTKLVDWKRAKNEIPLVDEANSKVYYGVDALLQILGAKRSFFLWFAKQYFLVAAAKVFYKFVSFNRRVIIPAPINTECTFDAKPDFSISYRMAYLIFSWLITSFILINYSALLAQYIGATNLGREFLICAGQMAFQSVLLLAFKKQREIIFEYLGNMMTVSLLGALLLSPLLLVHVAFSKMNTFVYLGYFFLVVTFMLYDHVRRVKLVAAPKWLSATWVLYRILVLILILFLK